MSSACLTGTKRVEYHDKDWVEFCYDKGGALIEATNQHTILKFERNPARQIVKEWQCGHWIESVYDALGRRTHVNSSLGAIIATHRDEMGRSSKITAAQAGKRAWVAQMRYNELGKETERAMPGGLMSIWLYDATGKAIKHSVANRRRDTRMRCYEWDVNNKLKRAKNELTGDHTAFSYDDHGYLVASRVNDRYSYIFRYPDEAGNIYETHEKTDRIYSPGGRLEHTGVNTGELKNKARGGHGKLVTKGTKYDFDAQGNLIKKETSTGDVWQYLYYSSGMLSKVVLPDETEITFKYDPIGRRIEKQAAGFTKRFIWDGNHPLHELEGLELVTWLFDDGFVPMAKLTNEGAYSIIPDYLGTPTEAYSGTGERIWSAELDIYGRLRSLAGDVGFVPFRFQGQYHDIEIGLYHNRLRYYDPGSGQYTQQVPFGLCPQAAIACYSPNPYSYVRDPNWQVNPFGGHI